MLGNEAYHSSKVPGLGAQAANFRTGGARAKIDSRFQFNNSVLTLEALNVLTPERNELKLLGTVAINKDLNLKGSAFLAQAPVSGSIREANSDTQGRLEFPLTVTGKANAPELNLMSETIERMIQKTAQNEGQKAKKQIQSQAEQEAKKKANEIKQNFQQDPKKALQNLFGH